MPFDLSAIDAQLAALGAVPSNLRDLLKRMSVPFSSLEETDDRLGALGSADFQFKITPRAVRKDPRSGEISLPKPVYRPHLPASGELDLDESTPRSGSYPLEEEVELPRDDEIPSSAPPADVLPITGPSAGRIAIPATLALESSPLSLFPEGDDEPQTSQDVLDVLPVTRKPSQDVAVPSARPSLGARDPDAEFDSLFEEATSPSGVPTRSLEDDGLSVDDLLSGLSSHKPAASAEMSESDSALEALFGIDDAESTEIVETRTVFGETDLPNLDPFPAEEELGSSEFEIVLDEAGEAKDIVRSDRPGPRKSPLPPATVEDKRPSFLGRLFGKKDE
jgi:hypothetical protein